MNEKSFKAYKNILIYDISYKIFVGSKPLIIGFDEINGFIRIYYGIRYLVLFCSGLYDVIYDKIKYLISKKVMLRLVLIIILQESELIHIILYP